MYKSQVSSILKNLVKERETPAPSEGSTGMGSEYMPLSSGKKRTDPSKNQENLLGKL